jgi:hypothetical protein
MTLARDALLLLSLLQFQGKVHDVKQNLYHFSSLMQNYRSLHWLCCQSVVPTSPLSLESNLRQLAALNISTGSRQAPFNSDCSLLELYIRGVGGQELRAALAGAEGLSSPDKPILVWSELLPQSVNLLLSQLYPSLYLYIWMPVSVRLGLDNSAHY